MYHYRSNTYFPSIMNKTFDACHILKNLNKIPYVHLVAELIHENGNFAKKCPIKPVK